MEIERLDFRDSVTTLADELHIDISQYQKNPEAMSKKQSQREKMKLLNKRAQKFFTTHFTPDSPAATYMREKRELSEETIEHFGI